MNTDQVTYELVFPEGLEHATAARLLVALSGLFVPAGRTGLGTFPTLVLEILSEPEGLHYQLSFPSDQADMVRHRLDGVVPGLTIRAVTEAPSYRWNRVVVLHRPDEGLVEPDPKMIPTLLRSLRGLRPAEAVLVQVLITSAGGPAHGAGEPAFLVSGRLAAAAKTDSRADVLLHRTRTAYRDLQVFEWPRLRTRPQAGREVHERRLSRFEWRGVMAAQSLAVVCGLPIGSPQIPGLELGPSKQLVAEAAIGSAGRRILRSNVLGDERILALAAEDRTRHMYLVGPTSSGKTTVLENLVVDDIGENFGVAYIDPKGDSVERVLDCIPRRRLRDVVLFDPGDPELSMGFNLLAGRNPYAVAGQVVTIFDKLYGISSAPRAINILRNVLITLALGGYTVCEVPLILSSGAAGRRFRAQLVPQIARNAPLRQFWAEFELLQTRDKDDRTDPILHRLNAMLVYPQLSAAFGQRTMGFDMDHILAENKILLIRLNQGTLGDEIRPMVGALVAAKFWQAVQARPGGQDRRPFFWYVDEFQEMLKGSDSYEQMAAQARGYDVGLILAQQQIGSLSPTLRAEVFTNLRSKLVFQTTNDEHARILAKELGEPVDANDIKKLAQFEVIARLYAGGRSSRAVSGQTFVPPSPTGLRLIARARALQQARPIDEVLAELDLRHGTDSAANTRLPRLD